MKIGFEKAVEGAGLDERIGIAFTYGNYPNCGGVILGVSLYWNCTKYWFGIHFDYKETL